MNHNYSDNITSQNGNFTESALATYGTILAVVLTIAAFVVGFSKTNIFAALAFLPLIGYFIHEFMNRLAAEKDDSPKAIKTPTANATAFLLQDNLILRVSLSLLIVAVIAAYAKAHVAPQPQSASITSPLSTK